MMKNRETPMKNDEKREEKQCNMMKKRETKMKNNEKEKKKQ